MVSSVAFDTICCCEGPRAVGRINEIVFIKCLAQCLYTFLSLLSFRLLSFSFSDDFVEGNIRAMMRQESDCTVSKL